jgi:hypothetical protein
MMKLLFLFPLFLLACAAPSGQTESPISGRSSPKEANASSEPSQEKTAVAPVQVERCLANTVARGRVDLLLKQEPRYYLSGDFDGDGYPDYAVAIKGRKTGRNGVLICTGKDRVFMLGADKTTDLPFSDMPNDNFVSSKWDVMSKEEAEELHNIEKEPPARVAYPKGDSIALIWEDGICVIWWDGSRYRWGCGL